MTHIPEVLEVMEGGDNSTSKKTKRVLQVPYILSIFISIIFLLSLLTCTFLLFKYLSCRETGVTIVKEAEEDLRLLMDFQVMKHNVNVRLPRSVVPDSYRLTIIPYIWEGAFLRIWLSF